jgi:hypothetical protein
MAYDKVVDSSVLDAGLKQIADAIREKGGTSDNLAFPQAMADAIAAIEAGGGGDVIVETGSITTAADSSDGTPITFDLSGNPGVRPDIFVWLKTPSTSYTKNDSFVAQLVIYNHETNNDGRDLFKVYSYGYNNSSSTSFAPWLVKNTTIDVEIDKGAINVKSQSVLIKASTYTWIAIWGTTV